jgi:hypothetical protein
VYVNYIFPAIVLCLTGMLYSPIKKKKKKKKKKEKEKPAKCLVAASPQASRSKFKKMVEMQSGNLKNIYIFFSISGSNII